MNFCIEKIVQEDVKLIILHASPNEFHSLQITPVELVQVCFQVYFFKVIVE